MSNETSTGRTRYGDYEQVNGAVVNDLIDEIEALERQLAGPEEIDELYDYEYEGREVDWLLLGKVNELVRAINKLRSSP